MTPKQVRVKVRCEACHASTILSPEQYRTLLRESRVVLSCSRCAHRFAYTPVEMVPAAPEPPMPAEVNLPLDVEPPPAPAEMPAPKLAPEFPPPPFAPLGGGAATPAKPSTPAFAPLGGEAAAPVPAAPRTKRTEEAAGGEKQSLTLNERWKRLPNWVQWSVVGLTVVVLGIVIFAMPVGGSGNGKPETPDTRPAKAKPETPDSRPAKASPEPSAGDKTPPRERQP